MTKIALFLAALTLIPLSARAEDYCRPTSDGKSRIEKTGKFCPTGYFSSGNCCEAFHNDTPTAFPKIEGKACPSGTFRSGSACKAFR